MSFDNTLRKPLVHKDKKSCARTVFAVESDGKATFQTIFFVAIAVACLPLRYQ